MPEVQDVDCLTLNCEQNPVHVGFAAVEQLPHLEREFRILWRYRAALRKIGEGRDGLLEGQEPAKACIPRMSRNQPIQNLV